MFRSMTDSACGILVVALLGATAGCAASGGARDTESGPVHESVAAAEEALVAGRHEQAIELLAGSEDDWEGHPEPATNLGIALAAQDRLGEAETAFRQALDLDPDFAPAWSELGIVLRRQGRFQEAEEAYARALQADPDYPLAWKNRGVLLDLYLARPAEALECYERYLELAGEDGTSVTDWVVELRARLQRRVAEG